MAAPHVVRLSRFYLPILGLALLLGVAGCKTKPRYLVGDHLIPMGSSDPTQIVTVVAVEPDGYRVASGGSAEGGAPVQTLQRKAIESYYVRVELPIGGRWTRREDLATPSPAATSSPAAPPPPTAIPIPVAVDFAKLTASVQPSVVLISVFDHTGRMTKTGTGFFVSDDGRIVTTFRTIEGAINAIAKVSNGKFYNVSGVLATSPTDDLAVIKADAAHIPFIAPAKIGRGETGMRVAIIESTLRRRNGTATEAKIGALRREHGADGLQLNGENLVASVGAPVIDERGDLVGIATGDESESALSWVRSAGAVPSLLAQVPPNAMPRWSAAPSPTPTASPSPSGSPKPSASPQLSAGPGAGLVYAPQPRYPTAARFSYRRVEGTGRYAIQFGPNGLVTNVQTVQSAGSDALDNAALDTLRTWRAQPGRPSQRTVVIPFRRDR